MSAAAMIELPSTPCHFKLPVYLPAPLTKRNVYPNTLQCSCKLKRLRYANFWQYQFLF